MIVPNLSELQAAAARATIIGGGGTVPSGATLGELQALAAETVIAGGGIAVNPIQEDPEHPGLYLIGSA